VAVDKPSGLLTPAPEPAKDEPSNVTSAANAEENMDSMDSTDVPMNGTPLKSNVEGAEKMASTAVAVGPNGTHSSQSNGHAPEAVSESEPENAQRDAAVEKDGAGPKQVTLPVETMPSANPDKPVSSIEEEPGAMKDADPKNEAVASGATESSNGVPGVDDTLDKPPPESIKKVTQEHEAGHKSASPSMQARSAMRKPKEENKPAAISTNTPTKMTPGSENVRTPVSANRPRSSGTQASSTPSKKAKSPRDLSSRASRTSLTAPTASSSAKSKTQASQSDAPSSGQGRR